MTDSRTEAIELEAADWAIRLAYEPDDIMLRDSFNEWVSSSAEHARIWAGMDRVNQGLVQLLPVDTEGWPETNPTRCRRNKGSRSRLLALAGLGFAAAAAVVFAFVSLSVLPEPADVKTETAEQRTIHLEDQSHLHLAPESAAAMDFDLDFRNVKLLEGDAYFEVEPDPDRPFIVTASGVRISVLGTAFEVDQDLGRVSVAVSHGRVLVEREGELAIREELGAGDRLSINLDSGITISSEVETAAIAEWRESQITVFDRPILEVIEELRKYHSGAILLDDEFANKRVTGVYRLDDPMQTLRGLARAHGGELKSITPWIARLDLADE